MKKIYFLMTAVLLSGGVFAEDLAMHLDNYTDAQATSDDPLMMDFTIENVGGTISAGDTIYWSFVIGTTTYATNDLASGFVMYTVLQADMLMNDSFAIDAMDPTGSWLGTEFGSANGSFCAMVYGVGAISLGLGNTDSNINDNRECVDYTNLGAGFGVTNVAEISVYPNPAVDAVNFSLGGNIVDEIRIMDISGRVIDVISVNGSNEILDVTAYRSGIYFYAIIKNEEAILTEKFVVK